LYLKNADSHHFLSSNFSISFMRNIPHAIYLPHVHYCHEAIFSCLFPHFFLFFLKKRESCTLVTSLLEVTRIHMKNRSVLKDGWEDVQSGATPKRYDLSQGDFLKFSFFFLFLVLLRLKQIFLCTSTNFRRYIISYEYPMDIFGYTKFLDMQNYIRKVTWNYFLRGSVRFLFFFWSFLRNSIIPSPSSVDYLVITAKSAET